MTSLTLTLESDSAAFDEGNAPYEVSLILEKAAEKIRDGKTSGVLRDYNGNRVGEYKFDQ